MDRTVAVSRDDGVAVVTVDNPPVNALSDEVIVALSEVAARIDRDRSIRAVVVTGAGEDTFIAGADLHALRHAIDAPGRIEEHLAITAPMFRAWRGLRQPVIAAVTGNAMGGGLELAMSADLIVADPDARLGLPEVTLGLIPGAGGTQLLPARVGPAARRLILLGEILDSDEALALGLIDLISSPGEARAEAERVATRLSRLPAVAVQNAKQAVNHAIEAGALDGLEAERALFVATSRTQDAMEGIDAFLARRRPAFSHG